jgi:putative hydrolase of the HAD superfamily
MTGNRSILPLVELPNDGAISFAGERLRDQTLLIDADDTLWENNIYFERAIVNFISFLNHHEFSPIEVRDVLNQVERECIAKHGYGLNSFAHALADTFERLSVEPLTPALRESIHGFAHAIAENPIELIAGVPDTLDYLCQRHRLIVTTKGNPVEQSGKVERSGLKHYFSAIEVVAEKNSSTYRGISEKYDLCLESTWMVGNSPKSDINPALAAGLNAVFVPHDQTWILEYEEICQSGDCGKLLVLERFSGLTNYF